MKERIVLFFKKLCSVKILIGIPLLTIMVYNEKIDGLVYTIAILTLLGIREAFKVLKNG